MVEPPAWFVVWVFLFGSCLLITLRFIVNTPRISWDPHFLSPQQLGLPLFLAKLEHLSLGHCTYLPQSSRPGQGGLSKMCVIINLPGWFIITLLAPLCSFSTLLCPALCINLASLPDGLDLADTSHQQEVGGQEENFWNVFLCSFLLGWGFGCA